jgi:branched-chain amino acid transport system permease protein
MTDWPVLVVTGVMSGLVTGLAALAVTLVFGIARFANAATGDVMTLGAYVALGVGTATGSLLLGGAAGIVAAMLAGVIAYWLVFRQLAGRSSVTALLASIGVGFMIRSGLALVYGYQQQVFAIPLARPWRPWGVRILPIDAELAALALATLAVVFLVLHATPMGRRMRAVADDPALAQVSGIAPQKVMIALWTMAGGVAAIAGIMLAMKTAVAPEMGWNTLLPGFTAAILGGIGSPIGAVLAGLILGLVQELASPFVGFTYKLAVVFIALLLVLLVRPSGLFGRRERLR